MLMGPTKWQWWPYLNVLKEEGKVIMDFGMAYVGIA